MRESHPRFTQTWSAEIGDATTRAASWSTPPWNIRATMQNLTLDVKPNQGRLVRQGVSSSM
eukprot:4795189-Prorocentrum_lima.AAC.1